MTVFHDLDILNKYIQSFFKASNGLHSSSTFIPIINIFPLGNI